MSQVEFVGNIEPDGKIILPVDVNKAISGEPRRVKVVLYWPDAQDDKAWQQASLAAFRKQDGPADALYDRL